MDPIRRKRAFLPKVKTGCRTCKIRKVKCDECKPECNRCLSTGRKCDGYEPASRTPSPGSSSSLQTQPDMFTSQAERRSFDFFQARACQTLGGYFHLQFWSREVMQSAMHYPPIRHLVIALGAAYEGFESETSGSPGAGEPSASKHLALQQANQSIRLMNDLFQTASTSGPSLENTSSILMASILFTYIASLQGHLSQAIEHVRAGLRVLEESEASLLEQSSSSSIYPVPLHQLRSILISVYGQVRCIINDEALTKWNRDHLVSELEPVTLFASIPEAHDYVERLHHNMLAYLQSVDFHPATTPAEHAAYDKRRHDLFRALGQGRDALEILQTVSPERHQQESGITVLRIYLTLVEMRLSLHALRPDEREAAFDHLEPYLERILGDCEAVVEADRANQTSSSCCSGLGIVLPLHTVAARCRNPKVRRKALDLLLSGTRRECLWDAGMTANIVRKTLDIEEEGSDEEAGSLSEGPRRIPGEKRVEEVKIEFREDKKAHLRFVTVGSRKRNEMGIQRTVEW
ncbi:hypothetical protein LTR10_014261 [Elasticomyces elasticus]|uniref:Zn(2)-C6 fungal-type domain-containing protein n=1 Tax=Exophiala sideris TaxID=1016849 RepID=A0ABR0JI77_9EURO|nr:hypothetical protein LTR10_014261 [Elasticomyces elasticus]KAK5034301.1 hypothetical protein LTS07_003221 [Exophiala sideris]KAK5042598.1 hypothetical protein LTR13_001445 [Exophiala sideris]KAK5065680.1 hypothetical protein LTR69_003229 [Exophiala sideris]KAK5185862.1 hypothetical protein LTR44_001911 [Eurotiomycetes sp. CCFEE 6388]